MKIFLAFCSIAILLHLSYGLPTKSKSMPWVNSGYYQSDIRLTDQQKQALDSRTSMLNPWAFWRNNLVPYEIDSSFNAAERAAIMAGINELNRRTCLLFTPRQANHVDFIRIAGESEYRGCWSWLGRIGGMQEIGLDRRGGCVTDYITIHEILHAIGFFHMHSASNRNNHVRILWQNIQPGEEHNFDMVSDTTTTDFGLPYDYKSVMHYDQYSFSINNQPTLVAVDPTIEIGWNDQLTQTDVDRVLRMYC